MFHQIWCKPGGRGAETILGTVSGSLDSPSISPEHAGMIPIMAANRQHALPRAVEDSMRFGLMSQANGLRLEPGVYGFALEGEHAEDALMHAGEVLVGYEPVEGLDS